MEIQQSSSVNTEIASPALKRKHDEVPQDDDDLVSDDEGGLLIDDIYIPPPCAPACSLVTIGPRLIIVDMKNNFFKSYGENVTLGPFYKTFNAIIGPNGSGKSNVIDSILFVFGYRATKIRCKKLSVLLHNSEKFPNVQSCSVSIKFALIIDGEGNNFEVVPGSEFSISRIANKDNSSYYMIDDRRVHFRDVAKLLKGHGIDMEHNRFLILQGQVEQIATMKSKGENEHETGVLEYLEDIIGTSRYIKPLQLLEERVEFLSTRRIDKMNMLKVVEEVVNELFGPMQEAVKFLKCENKVVTCQNMVYQKRIHELGLKMKEAQEESDQIHETQKEVGEQLKQLQEQKKEKEKEMRKDSQKHDSLRKRKDNLQLAFDSASKKDMQLQESLKMHSNSKKKTKQLLEEQKKMVEQYESVPDKNSAEIKQLEIKKKELGEKKVKLETEREEKMASISEETKDLRKEKEELQADLVALKKTVDQSKADYNLAESTLKIYMKNEDSEREKCNQLIAQQENCTKTILAHTATLNDLNGKIPVATQKLNDAVKELGELRPKEAKILESIRTKRHSLEEKRSTMQASKSRGRVLDSLIQQKREGKCPGLYGRLGDLGGIDAKYDVAVSTACGPLDSIVVDTIETGLWCIDYLKENDIGRATFIALDKQEYLRQQYQAPIQTPENVPRLFDLIKVQDEVVKTAFYYALRDTLVAKDLDQASRVAYGRTRYRVVTLQGQMIEQSGTMSGGGRPMRGRMGQSATCVNIDPKDLSSLEKEVGEMEQRKLQYSERKVELEEEIMTLQSSLRKMKLECDKFTVELRGLEEQNPRIKRQLNEQRVKANQTKADPKETKKLQEIVEMKKKVFDEASKTIEHLEEEVNRLTAEIDAKGAGQIKLIQNKLNEVTKQLNVVEKEILRLNVNMTTAVNNHEKSTKKIERLEKDLKVTQEQMTTLAEQRKEIEEDASKLLVCLQEVKSTLEEAELSFTEVKESINLLTDKENQIKLQKVDIDQKLQNISKTINKCKAKINEWKDKLAKLELNAIPEEAPEPLKGYSEEEISQIDIKETEQQLEMAEQMLKSLKPNLSAIDEYAEQKTKFDERKMELDEITRKRNEMKKVYDDVRQRRKDEFLNGYNIIKIKFKEMYQMITLEGDADLDLVDSFDPFSEGVQLYVRPPKKTWKKILNLSGGEKTLTSLALVFALHYYKPSPLYVLDEIDAALDFKNVSIIGHYIKEHAKNAQFLIITLRQEMFHLADILIGIYKVSDCTGSIAYDPRSDEDSETETTERAVAPAPSVEPVASTCTAHNGLQQNQSIAVEIETETF